jgi:L-alanine-DL-glutamate epimerase-like enolase superfamily enzyme
MPFRFNYGHFESPMRFNFKHASAERSETQNVIVSLTDNKGRTGYGEGCPREYVTGETTRSAHTFLEEYGRAIAASASNIKTFRMWIEENKILIDKNPSAFCAIELAVLDLLGQGKKTRS